MTPLDDELRRTLSDRAATVAPSSDPLDGIEARARGIRRRRVATSVAGAVAVVAAVALAVPALTPDGKVRLEPAAPSATPSVTSTATASPTQQRPANVLTWELRGKDAYSPDTLDLRRRFVQAFGHNDPNDAEYMPLYVNQVDGVSFTTGQAWLIGGSSAYTVSYAVGPDNVPQFFLGRVTPTNPWGLVFLITGSGGPSDLLVVLPRPGVGQVSYDKDGSGAFTPVASGRSDLDNVALIDRDRQASNDRLEVLDGDGNLDNPLYRGPVTPLLCSLNECG